MNTRELIEKAMVELAGLREDTHDKQAKAAGANIRELLVQALASLDGVVLSNQEAKDIRECMQSYRAMMRGEADIKNDTPLLDSLLAKLAQPSCRENAQTSTHDTQRVDGVVQLSREQAELAMIALFYRGQQFGHESSYDKQQACRLAESAIASQLAKLAQSEKGSE